MTPMTTASARPYPDGIGPEHARPGAIGRRWLPVVVLAALLAVALSGALGGRPNPVVSRGSSTAALSFKAPQVLRSGEFFEMRATVRARRAIARPVVVVSADYLRDLTINSFIPAASEESFEDGMFTFEFAPLPAGGELEVKIDGQVNPPLVGLNRGRLELRDGQRTLVTLEPSLRVLP